MWSRFTSALKPKEAQPSQSQSDIISKVHEQHPNMSMFHANETGVIEAPPDLPPSPSVHNKKSMFKRMSRNALNDAELRAHLPTAGPPALPPKGFSANGNGSQVSLGNHATEPRRSQDIPRRSSYDMLRPSPDREKRAHDTTRSVKDVRRPSIDFLRQGQDTNSNLRPSSPDIHDARPSLDILATPVDRYNSTRSILRDKNTPGTGQNVRFNGTDAFKVITPDHSHSHSLSLSTELQGKDKAQPALPQDENPFMTRLASASASTSSPKSKSLHPSLGDIFAPLNEQQPPATSTPDQSDMSMSSFNHFVVEGNSNLFDVSQQLDMPAFAPPGLDIPEFPPPGLGFDVHSPMFEGSFNQEDNHNRDQEHEDEHSQLLAEGGLNEYAERFTSTPYRKEAKGKGREGNEDASAEFPVAPRVIDETIFHSQERSPKLPGPLHERSHSFSAGQTLFYSVGNGGHKSNISNNSNKSNKSTPDSSAAYPSSELKPESISASSSSSAPSPPAPSSSSKKLTRGRAMSDTVFQTMLKSKPTASPEADINDESSSGLVVYSAGQGEGEAEPDPFSAHANTYYTPQTMIPTTPPRGSSISSSTNNNNINSSNSNNSAHLHMQQRHTRKTSKEESLIMSLQTELSLKTELCAQYETDLKARDEAVALISARLEAHERDDSKRRGALRQWKKKVQELERACRLLEEAVEDSRQESMERSVERSVMDEASGAALRMLHKQIAALERDRQEWGRKEAGLREEVGRLEGLLEVHDRSERELRHGISQAKEQIDMMGNVSLGLVDEEDIKRILEERSAEDTQRFRTAELELRQEAEEWRCRAEGLENERRGWEERVEHGASMLRIREEEMRTLKAELEAQWARTEAEAGRYAALVRERDDVVEERDSIRAGLKELEGRMGDVEAEWGEEAERRVELEAALEEAGGVQKELEEEANELKDQLRDATEHIEHLAQDIEKRDQQLAALEDEQHFATDNAARLQAHLTQRDEELAQQSQRVRERQDAAEALREEMSGLRREHNRLLHEQSRVLEDATGQHDVTQAQLADLVRAKADLEVQLKLARERVQSLQSDGDGFQKQLKGLKADSADKEVRIVQLTKQLKQSKEDLEQMNIALDSKQQELELIKRKLGTRGTAGATPVPGTKLPRHRRDSSVFGATPASRPESALSDSGTDSATTIKKKSSLDAASGIVSSRVAALARSNRPNGVPAMPASSSSSASGKLGASTAPPANTNANSKPRSSFSDTPTPLGRSGLSRSSSIGATTPVSPTQLRTPAQHRKVVSLAGGEQVKAKLMKAPSTPRTVPEELEEEKENVDTSGAMAAARRRSLVPVSG